MPRKLRFEKVTLGPEDYRVLVHDPERWEGCELHIFSSKEEREEYITRRKKNDSSTE